MKLEETKISFFFNVCLSRKCHLWLIILLMCCQVYILSLHRQTVNTVARLEHNNTGVDEEGQESTRSVVNSSTLVKLKDLKEGVRNSDKLNANKTILMLNHTTQETDVNKMARHGADGRKSKYLLVLCTTWLSDPDKYDLHNNTLLNWASLKPIVHPVVFTDDPVLAKLCERYGWSSLPYNKTATASRVPVLKYMVLEIKRLFDSEFYGYANSDILFTSTIWETLTAVRYSGLNMGRPLLVIGRRTNVGNLSREVAKCHANITEVALRRGELFFEWAMDFFLTNPVYPWMDIPEVIIGSLAYDNWLLMNAVERSFPVIDATKTLLSLHQTSKGGNWESSNKPNVKYNTNLLNTYFNRTLPYYRGKTDCATYLSHRVNDAIHIDRQTVAPHCN